MKFILVFFILSNLSFAHTATIMSYNVENLFDTTHDEGKEDWEYLPKNYPGKNEACMKESSKKRRQECLDSDWNEKKLELKINQIVEVVKSAVPELPDFLALVEVENKNVVGQLASKLGYKDFEITESPDNRGVDVALLYKESGQLKKISRNELKVPTDFPTRNILEVHFQTGSTSTTIFVNHWPSLHNPDSSRVKAAETLVTRINEILKSSADERIYIMGDFNTIDSNNPHPFKTVLLKDDLLKDIHSAVIENKNISEDHKKKLHSGTYYFAPRDEWNLLDHFFVNKNVYSDKHFEELLKSYNIYSNANMLKEVKKKINSDNEKGLKIIFSPKRYNVDATAKQDAGYSDHLPIILKFNYEDKPIEIKAKKILKSKAKQKN